MIVSVLTRKTKVSDREEWESRLSSILPRIKEVLEGQPGFAGVQYMWGVDGDGEMAQVTWWNTLDDCRRYVRMGAAATVATIEDAALPTAPHPDGAWVRRTYEVVPSP